ncbi:PRTRC system protein C [Chitinophaga sp. NPDC101104]|uniref:PRTRC system protein C n=1 Tax=Chitinophaga sp. NPDC101104 TaxID=3390561 RepID=UPI003CFE4894
MVIEGMIRQFRYKPDRTKEELHLADPDPTLTPDEVRHHFATTMPLCTALISATVEKPEIEDGKILVYHFKNNLGTKG